MLYILNLCQVCMNLELYNPVLWTPIYFHNRKKIHALFYVLSKIILLLTIFQLKITHFYMLPIIFAAKHYDNETDIGLKESRISALKKSAEMETLIELSEEILQKWHKNRCMIFGL